MQEEEKQYQVPQLKKAHSEVDEETRKLIAQIQEMEIMQMERLYEDQLKPLNEDEEIKALMGGG